MDEKIQKKLDELFMAYRKNLPNKVNGIEMLWNDLLLNWEVVKFQTLHRDVHSLCGSAGTYGYPELGKTARQMEVFLKSRLGSGTLSTADQQIITDNLQTLKAVLVSELPEDTPLIAADHSKVNEEKLVYIIEQDQVLVQALSESLKQVGYRAHYIQDLITLQLAIEEKLPLAIVMNTNYLDNTGVEFFSDIQKKLPSPIPLFCIVPNAELLPRLNAVRAGSEAFFQKPVDTSYLAQVLIHRCDLTVSSSYRILIIDDSASLADYYALILNQAGMIARAMTNPMHLLTELEEFQPDLILMDIYMPDCTGLELAAVLRQEANYTKLPIIFLSTEEDKNKKLFAISLGGDDFLTKPISAQHLISAVRSRSKRASILNYYMTTDSLTGLLNHSSILKQLDIELLQAQQKKIPLSFVMIDIDQFKNINDTFGHPLGDVVIKKLAELFLIRLRKHDTIGRYGGEEFALILPGASLAESKQICDGLRVKFSQYGFTADNTEFFVTFSAGVSCFDGENDAATIILEADQALYKAKQLGRNRVVTSNEQHNKREH